MTYESGPSVEPCRECNGAGRLPSDPGFRGTFGALLREKGVFLDRDMRLLLLALDKLDERLAAVEQRLDARA
jgi:hypothetical protein